MRLLHQGEGGAAMNNSTFSAATNHSTFSATADNSPFPAAANNSTFPARVLRSYQQRAATFLYERDAAVLVAPLGAGKGAAALTALAELIRDGLRRHALVIAPKLVATTVWPQEVASWHHLQHL